MPCSTPMTGLTRAKGLPLPTPLRVVGGTASTRTGHPNSNMTSQNLLVDKSLDAFKKHAAAHAVGIFDLRPNSTDPPGVSSGTCVRLGDRLFVATAAHVLQKLEPANLRVIVQRRNLSTLLVKVIAQGRATSRDADVGYLELEPDAEVEAVTPDRFDRSDVLPYDMLTVVFGTPFDRLRLSGNVRALAPRVLDAAFTWNAQALSYATNPLPLTDWPKDTAIRYRPETHRMLRYTEGVELDSGSSVGLIKPHGMSGGGIWVVPLRLAEGSAVLWSPMDARLAGIQTGVLESSSALVGCSLSPWIDLMVTKFPDLRDVLSVTT